MQHCESARARRLAKTSEPVVLYRDLVAFVLKLGRAARSRRRRAREEGEQRRAEREQWKKAEERQRKERERVR